MIENNFLTFLALYHRISLNHFAFISFGDYKMEILHNITFQGWKKNDAYIDRSKISDGNGNYVLWVGSSGLIFSASYDTNKRPINTSKWKIKKKKKKKIKHTHTQKITYLING